MSKHTHVRCYMLHRRPTHCTTPVRLNTRVMSTLLQPALRCSTVAKCVRCVRFHDKKEKKKTDENLRLKKTQVFLRTHFADGFYASHQMRCVAFTLSQSAFDCHETLPRRTLRPEVPNTSTTRKREILPQKERERASARVHSVLLP